MMPHCKREAQYEIFPEMLPVVQSSPKLVLPIQRSAEIDIARVASIFGVTLASARNMAQDHLFPGSYKISALTPWRINYDSVVAYCNSLRLRHNISPRLVPLAPGRRHRDEELLPFPLRDTIYIGEVCATLDCSRGTVSGLLDTGALIGYRVRTEDVTGNRWRIYRPSLVRYLESLRSTAQSHVSAVPHR